MLRLARSQSPFALFDELLRVPVSCPTVRRTPGFALYADDEAVTLRAPLPGLDPEALDVSLEGDVLRVRAERPDAAPEAEEPGRVILRELSSPRADLSVRLGFRADADGIRARYERGVVTVRVPRPAEERTRRIPISND